MQFEGRLEDTVLLDILQIHLMTAQEGKLEVFGEKKGFLYLRDGNIVSAVYGELKGKPAVREILRLQKGRFRFDSRASLPKEECSLPLKEIILEITKEMDEWKEIRRIIPSFDVIPRIITPLKEEDMAKLSQKEQDIISQIDGKSSIRRIVDRCRLPRSEVVMAMFEMIQKEIIEMLPLKREKTLPRLLQSTPVIILAVSLATAITFLLILSPRFAKSKRPTVTVMELKSPEEVMMEERGVEVEERFKPEVIEKPRPAPMVEKKVTAPAKPIEEIKEEPAKFVRVEEEPEAIIVPFEKVEHPPILKSIPKPEYPDIVKEVGLEGRVVVNVLVGTDGKVENVELIKSSGIKAFDDVALKSAWKATFVPAKQRDRLVKVWVAVPFVFSSE